jgi:hypothetical protein
MTTFDKDRKYISPKPKEEKKEENKKESEPDIEYSEEK